MRWLSCGSGSLSVPPRRTPCDAGLSSRSESNIASALATSWKRSAGLRARHLEKNSSKPWGKSWATPRALARSLAVGRGSNNSSRISTFTPAPSSLHARQKYLPVSTKNASRPSAHTSVAGVTVERSSVCSGAIHAGVPIAEVASVRASASTLATPKSSTFTRVPPRARRPRARNTFSGLRSRWITPMPWAAPSACASCSNSSMADATSMGPRLMTRVKSVSPWSSSITMKGMRVAESTPAPSTCTTWSLGMRALTRASCWKRSTVLASLRYSSRMIFSARWLPVDS